MADTNETHDDIIAEMRFHGHQNIDAEKDKSEYGILTMEGRIAQNYADRLDLAHKREIDELKKQVADLQQQLPKPDPKWRDICAKCFESGATEPPDCEYYTEDGCMSPIPDQHPLIQVGNAAKLREALTKVKEWMEHRIATCGFEFSATFPTMLEDVVLPAFAAPPRNCDVYTADELKVIFKRELVSELPIANEHEKNLITITAMRMIDMLFATTKEGGNDGNE